MNINADTFAIILNIIGILILFMVQKPLIEETHTTYFYQEKELEVKEKLLSVKKRTRRRWSYIGIMFIIISTIIMLINSIS